MNFSIRSFYISACFPLLFPLCWLIGLRSRPKLPVAISQSSFFQNPIVLLRFIPSLLIALCSVLLILALARPQKSNEHVEQWSEDIDIMLALDISESMCIEDFKPNRLEVAKNGARDFVAGRMQDRMGIVVFSGDAYSLATLTTDYDLLFELITTINFSMI